jgi:hypothetical protein
MIHKIAEFKPIQAITGEADGNTTARTKYYITRRRARPSCPSRRLQPVLPSPRCFPQVQEQGLALGGGGRSPGHGVELNGLPVLKPAR